VKIYTKTGDDGTTGLLGGGRVEKSNARIAANGSIDELNCQLGIAAALAPSAGVAAAILSLQQLLFELGADISGPGNRITPEDIRKVEEKIDAATEQLPPLTAFILPGGHPVAAQLHLARAVCRRAERDACRLAEQTAVNSLTLALLNRLSDYLFVLARLENHLTGTQETRWLP